MLVGRFGKLAELLPLGWVGGGPPIRATTTILPSPPPGAGGSYHAAGGEEGPAVGVDAAAQLRWPGLTLLQPGEGGAVAPPGGWGRWGGWGGWGRGRVGGLCGVQGWEGRGLQTPPPGNLVMVWRWFYLETAS